MPYLRLYSREIAVENKHDVVQKLIEITLRAFCLRPEERHLITVQFIPSPVDEIDDSQPQIPRGADFMLEVIAHHLTETKKRKFGEEAATLLTPLLPTKARSRIAHLLGVKSDLPSRVALEFSELSPAISDPFTLDTEPRAA
jgi:hypothetical protein